MRKTKETHTFDFRPLGLAIREAREKAGLSRNDLGDNPVYVVMLWSFSKAFFIS